ncbi:HAD family hydrolase [Candidatus Woesearchaeota archaeon]|nr:HAD family hydrolase [Candidatus Woesearchaeota archaeon]
MLSRRRFIKLTALSAGGVLFGCGSTRRSVKESAMYDNSIDTLILDFDGTLTNIEEEAKPYVEGFCKGLGRELKLSQSEIETYWNEARAKILKTPEKYGWELDGIIVASATSDPILICYSITDEILGKLGINLSEQERRALLAKLYLENYPKMSESFKEGVDEFLSEVWNLFEGNVYVVTNSSPDKVEKKISHLHSDHFRIPIIGGAKKYIVVNDWKAVPKTINISGLERPVYIRRQHYGEILNKIMKEQNTNASGITVVGDIWELDLALPQYFGMTVGLTPNKTTPQYEKDVVLNYKQGFIANGLGDVYRELKKRR